MKYRDLGLPHKMLVTNPHKISGTTTVKIRLLATNTHEQRGLDAHV